MVCLAARDGQADYRVHLKGVPNVGAFFRDEEGVALVMGTLDNPLSREHLRCVCSCLTSYTLILSNTAYHSVKMMATGQ